MLFELSTAFRFLKPSSRELARSLISLLSFAVITIVCWLVIVFYSVTEGLEKRWINQLVQFTGNIRLQPTVRYFQSYEFLIDQYCMASGYSTKPLGYHLKNVKDPWDEQVDGDLPNFLMKERPTNGKRPIASLAAFLQHVPYAEVLSAPILTQAEVDHWESGIEGTRPQHVTWKTNQNAQLISFSPWNDSLQKLLLPSTESDLTNLWYALEFIPLQLANKIFKDHFANNCAQNIQWRSKIVPIQSLSKNPTPSSHVLQLAVECNGSKQLIRIFAASQSHLIQLQADLDDLGIDALLQNAYVLSKDLLYTPGWVIASSWKQSPINFKTLWIELTTKATDSTDTTGQTRELSVPQSYLDPRGFTLTNSPPASKLLFDYNSQLQTPWIGILAPKILKDMGLHIGARIGIERELIGPLGPYQLRYQGLVMGYYDQGIFPLGARYLIAPWTAAQAFYQTTDHHPQSNYLQIWSEHPHAIANDLRMQLAANNIDSLFHTTTYEEFTFSRDLMTQLQSDRMLLSLIAVIILVVACSSIASMLVLLVNERRKEIALLKALGLAPWRIVLCFGISGSLMGLLSAVLGTGLAYATLQNIESLIAALSYLQGQPLLSPTFYGEHLPQSMSFYAVKLVIIGSWSLSTVAGCIACLHGARLSPSQLMRTL